MNTITINFLGKSVTLSFVEHRYRDNGRLALEAVDALTGEPFGMVTVNLDTPGQTRAAAATVKRRFGLLTRCLFCAICFMRFA